MASDGSDTACVVWHLQPVLALAALVPAVAAAAAAAAAAEGCSRRTALVCIWWRAAVACRRRRSCSSPADPGTLPSHSASPASAVARLELLPAASRTMTSRISATQETSTTCTNQSVAIIS